MNKGKQEAEIQNKVAKHYEYLRSSKKHTRLYNNHWYRLMVKGSLRKDDFVLDNGCGNGSFGEFFKGNVIGVDMSEEMLKFAKKRMKVKKGSSEKLPFKDSMFDIVLCKSVLHHLKNPKKAVDEMHRVLKKNGKIIISEPISNPIISLLRKSVSNSNHFSELHRDFKRKEFISLFPKNKFKLLKKRYFGYLSYPLLGFPDIVKIFEIFPFKMFFAKLLIIFDDLISNIFLINRLSWHLILVLKKGELK